MPLSRGKCLLSHTAMIFQGSASLDCLWCSGGDGLYGEVATAILQIESEKKKVLAKRLDLYTEGFAVG